MRQLTTAFLALMLLTLTAAARSATAGDTDLATLRQMANERYAEGDLERAAQVYLEISDRETVITSRATALVTAAWLLHLQGRDLAALESLERALTLNPERPLDATLYNRDFELLYARASEAATLARRARASELVESGLREMEAGRTERANELLTEAVQLSPEDATTWKHLGLASLRLQSYPTAAQAFQKGHDLDPADAEMARLLAQALRKSARGPEAIVVLSRCLENHPRDAALWSELGRSQWQQGAAEQAVLAFEHAVENDPNDAQGVAAPSLARLALIHYEQEAYEAAIGAARRATELNPADAATWNLLGLAQQANGEPEAAVTSLSSATEIAPDRAEYFVDLGNAYVAVGKVQLAESAFSRALALDPDSAAAAANLEAVRGRLVAERSIVTGATPTPKPRKPIPPKKIGLRFADLDYKQLELRGALVKEVQKKSPAARGGLRKGDLVLWIGEYEVLSDKDFFQYLKRNPPGDALELQYLRDGRIHEAQLALR